VIEIKHKTLLTEVVEDKYGVKFPEDTVGSVYSPLRKNLQSLGFIDTSFGMHPLLMDLKKEILTKDKSHLLAIYVRFGGIAITPSQHRKSATIIFNLEYYGDEKSKNYRQYISSLINKIKPYSLSTHYWLASSANPHSKAVECIYFVPKDLNALKNIVIFLNKKIELDSKKPAEFFKNTPVSRRSRGSIL